MEEKFNQSNEKNVPSKISVTMIDEVKSPADPVPLRHRNWSWPSFLFMMVFIVVTVIVGTVAVKSGFSELQSGPRIGWIILMFVAGCGGGAIIYNLGKHLFAKISGYQLAYLCLSGLCWDYSRIKPFYFDGSKLLEFHSLFKPKDDDMDRKPTMLSIGGIIVWFVFFIALLITFILLNMSSTVKAGLITGLVLSGTFPLYEMIPFRSDNPSDMYVLITTIKNQEERKAFNIYLYNKGNEFSDVDYIYPEFNEFDTYWKAKSGIYVLKKELYEAKVDDAIKTMTKLHKAGKYLDDSEKAQLSSERLFFLLLMNDNAGADRLFIGLPKDIKTEILRNTTLTSYRNSLLINGLLRDKEDATIENVKSANKILLPEYSSTKMQHEKKYYILSYNKIKSVNDKYNLPELAFTK